MCEELQQSLYLEVSNKGAGKGGSDQELPIEELEVIEIVETC